MNGNLGEVISTDVKSRIQKEIHQNIYIFQNYPNPFNTNTVIKYQISKLAFVSVTVYDIQGKEVIKLTSEKQKLGEYQVSWNGKDNEGGDVASGIYFYQLKINEFVQTKKLTLIR
jgi:flagellar hook assembly protein FlgD